MSEGMDLGSHGGAPPRMWTVTETHTLLDLIRDMALVPTLTRKGHQNWDVYERLNVVLRRCNIRASSVEIKDRWQCLKMKFWRLKRLADSGVAPFSGITADFPFYTEMEQLLLPQSKATSCKREADSTWQESLALPHTLSDSGGLVADDGIAEGISLRHPGERVQEHPTQDWGDLASALAQDAQQEDVAVDTGPVPGGLQSLLQDEVVFLRSEMHALHTVMERLVHSMNHLAQVEEKLSVQLGCVCSLVLQSAGQDRTSSNVTQEPSVVQETAPVTQGPRGGRVLRRSLRSKRPSVRYYP